MENTKKERETLLHSVQPLQQFLLKMGNK